MGSKAIRPIPLLCAAALLAFAAPLSATGDLLAQTRAARDAGRLADAEAKARAGMAASADPVWPLTLSLILSDQKRASEALAILDGPFAQPLPAGEKRMAEGFAHSRAGDDWQALRAYGEALRVLPGNAEAKVAMAGILDRLRAPYAAAALAGAPPFREADMAAALTRWGAEVRAPEIAQRFAGTDRALAAQDALLARLQNDPVSDPALIRRVRIDRIVALRDRVRMAEVVAEAESLQPLPLFATHAYADALLYLHRPGEALANYDAVLAAEPDNIQAGYGRFFALVETEDFQAAYAQIDAMAASRPRFVAYAGGQASNPDREYLFATTLAAESRLWGNEVAAGFARLQPIADGAPASPTVRFAMAGAYGARGWPRRADAETQIAASLDPEGLTGQVALAERHLARNRWKPAAAEADRLLALAPENLRVQRLKQEAEAQRGWLLEGSFAPAFNEGGGTNTQGEGYTFGARLSAPIIGSGVRLFGLMDSARAHPIEGEVTRNRVGGGVRWQGPDLDATAYATHSWGSLPQPSLGFTLDWAVDDRLSLSGGGEWHSLETPIRALLAGISGDSLSARANWRRDERFAASLGVAYLGLSDGNDRLSIGGSLVQLLHSRPHFDLTGRVDLYTSRNSQPGGPYFAPESDLSAAAGLRAQHVAWRRYERVFVQALSVDFGVYDQKGYSADWIGVLRYEHRWRRDPKTELSYGVTFDRRVYDGVAEKGLSFVVGLTQRFAR